MDNVNKYLIVDDFITDDDNVYSYIDKTIFDKYIGCNRHYVCFIIKMFNPCLKVDFLVIEPKINYVVSPNSLWICYDPATNIVTKFK